MDPEMAHKLAFVAQLFPFVFTDDSHRLNQEIETLRISRN